MESERPRVRVVPLRRDANRHLWEIAAVRDLTLLLLGAGLLWSFYALREIFVPVLLGLLCAHLFNPAISYMQKRWGWPRTLSISLILISLLTAIAALVIWLGPLLYNQAVGLVSNLPRYLEALANRFAIDLSDVSEPLDAALKKAQADPRQLLAQIFQTTGRALGWLTALVGMATYVTLALFLIPLYFFFFAWYFNDGLAKLESLLPKRYKPEILAILLQMDRAVGDFFRGRLVIAALVGVLFSAGWYLAGVPYWFALGMITGFLNIVPYASVISWPIAVLLRYVSELSSGGAVDWFDVVLWPSVVYAVVQLLEGWVLTPWIQSGQTHLSAVTIIVVVLIGAALVGVWGMLFAIPIAACIKILMVAAVLPRLRRWAAEH